MMNMNLEQADHFVRHAAKHAEEIRQGNFQKDIAEYSQKLLMARQIFLEISHDMVHVMRSKQFKGYENADFDFDTRLPEDWSDHEFSKFDYNSFNIGIRVKNTIDLGMVEERYILLSLEDAEQQMSVLGKAVQDCSVLLEMLKEQSKK